VPQPSLDARLEEKQGFGLGNDRFGGVELGKRFLRFVQPEELLDLVAEGTGAFDDQLPGEILNLPVEG